MQGVNFTNPRPASLAPGGKYPSKRQPTYQEYSVDQVLNIKTVATSPVKGDGVTDDTANINAILAANAGCKVIYFPAGTYIVSDTITIPIGSRVIGDAYGSAISATGSVFMNANAPVPMVRVGTPGDVGTIYVSDMIWTVADILPGAVLLEVNAAGANAGDVALWNTHFRVGGGSGSKVETRCSGAPSACKAAWAHLHVTSTASVYIENTWLWTADHDLDANNAQTISVGRGALVESQGAGTWLLGTGSEHTTLYQFNYHNAINVFSALQQSETPIWQGIAAGDGELDPAPWQNNLVVDSDPTFTSCANATDTACRLAWFELVRDSSNIFLYSQSDLAYIAAGAPFGPCSASDAGPCQDNAIDVTNSTSVYAYGINFHKMINMFTTGDGAKVLVPEAGNVGGLGSALAAFVSA